MTSNQKFEAYLLEERSCQISSRFDLKDGRGFLAQVEERSLQKNNK